MRSTLKKLAVAGVGALALSGAVSTEASADYLGYGNGDPGNWSFYTEQMGGPCAGVRTPKGVTPVCCLKYTPESTCPDRSVR